MNNNLYIKSAILQAALQLMPPLIRNTLFEDIDFQKKYGITTDAVISFSDSGISFQRSELYNAVRNYFSGSLVGSVLDKNGMKWEIVNVCEEDKLPELKLSNGEQYITLFGLVAFSPDKPTRLHYLDENASDVNLPNSAREEWCKILSELSCRFIRRLRASPALHMRNGKAIPIIHSFAVFCLQYSTSRQQT